jgi:type I restriction enzyme R subunit
VAVASANFAFLETHDPQLVRLAGLAERYFAEDPNTCLFKLRQFGELLATTVAARYAMLDVPEETQSDRLRRFKDRGVLPPDVLDLFHDIRKAGNDAVHDFADEHRTALTALKKARALAVWFHRSVSRDARFSPGPFIPPRQPVDESATLKAEMDRLNAELAVSRTAAEEAAAHAREEAEQRLSAEQRAALADKERAEWEALAQAFEDDKARVSAELASLQANAAASPPETIQAIVKQGLAAGEELDLDERETRRLIDAQLRATGWEADSETVSYKTGMKPQKGRNIAIAEWPTSNGPADYVLFCGLTVMAVVEAKRKNKDVPALVQHAKRYSRGFQAKGDVVLPDGGPWGENQVPFVFATNGRRYLKQHQWQALLEAD